MIFTLFKTEIFKTRHSLALLMMAACPLMVVLLNTGMMVKNANFGAASPKMWGHFWMGSMAVWCYFMLPLYIALAAALVNGNEHRNHTWRLMLTLPITHRQLYLSKLMVIVALVAGANILLMLALMAVNSAFALAGHPMDATLAYPKAWTVLKIMVASLPVLVIQHAVSWRSPNIVLPLAIGVCATMGILAVGSSEFWTWFPWSYVLMAANGSDTNMQVDALLLALMVGAPLLALSSYWLGSREVTA